MDKIRVGCAVLAVEGKSILLGRRGKSPQLGKWVLPGGGVELFEQFSDTAKREFKEETGLEILIGAIVQIEEIINPPDEHRIIIFVEARITGGNLLAASDLLEVRLFDPEELEALFLEGGLTPTVQKVLLETGYILSTRRSKAFIPVRTRKTIDRKILRGEARRAVAKARQYRSVGGEQLKFSDL